MIITMHVVVGIAVLAWVLWSENNNTPKNP